MSKEENLALAWFDGKYTQEQAQRSAEIQCLSFENIVNEYARLYEEQERLTGQSLLINNMESENNRYHYEFN